MAPQKRKDKPLVLLKSLGLVILCLSFGGILSCDWGSGTHSTTSSGSGTGTGWTITIQVGTNPLPFTGSPGQGTSTTTVMALVKDKTGAPAPKGTNICFTAILNGFLTAGATTGSTTLIKSLCETTTNDLGQSIQTYGAQLTTGNDTVEVSSQGVIAKVTINVI